MQIDPRVSVKTLFHRVASINYSSYECRFGTGDAVALISMRTNIEGYYTAASGFMGSALSRNPEHELNPPGTVDAFEQDGALYGRIVYTFDVQGGAATNHANEVLQVLPMHDLVVPNRQIWVVTDIVNGAYGVMLEILFHEVKMSRAEADLMNLTWGKYRR